MTSYISAQTIGDPIEEYSVIKFDDDVLRKVRHGEIGQFRMVLTKNKEYLIAADSVTEYDGGWFFTGYLPDGPDNSSVKLFVNSDGTKTGNVLIFGVALLGIKPSAELPAHLVYKLTGTWNYD